MRLSVALMLLLTACTNDPTENSEVVHDRYLDRHEDTFLIDDRNRAVDALQGVLAEEGYELVPTERSDVFRTDKKTEGKSTTELSIHMLTMLDKTMLTQVMEITRDETGKVTHKLRRDDLEWLVAQRAEPDRALALMRKANERADKVPVITRKK